MKEILTYNGETILIDDEDYDAAIKYRWCVSRSKGRHGEYKKVVTYSKGNKGVTYKKLILGYGAKMTLHKNMNPLDLRRENLLVFDSKSEYVGVMIKIYRKEISDETKSAIAKTLQGKYYSSNKKTKYIGVRYEPRDVHKWRSIIRYNGGLHYTGSFTTEEYAALAYDKKAFELYGSGAARNFPHLTYEELTEKLNRIKAEDAVIFYDLMSMRHQGRRFANVQKTSKYVGVCAKKGGKEKIWRATIYYHDKQYSLGAYKTEKEAALAYDKKAYEFYGDKARLNFPDEIKR